MNKGKKDNLLTLLYLWGLYFLVWPGSPPLGDINEADCVFGQAYGRNTMPDESKAGKFYKKCKRNDLRAIKKLVKYGFDPGIPNFDLAKEFKDLKEKYDLLGILQWEICVALFLLDEEWYVRNQHKIIGLWPVKGYFHTRAVKEMSVAIMKKYNKKNPIELCHKRQAVRAILIIWKLLGKLPIILKQRTVSFDKNSVQIWTKNKFLWIPREALGRWIHHILKRWVW